jgi:hypothetical protein
MKISAPARRFLKEVEKLAGVPLRMEHDNSGHRKVYLPDGRFVVASVSGDSNASRAAAGQIRRLLKEKRT